MDQSTPDRATPERTVESERTLPPPKSTPTPAESARNRGVKTRLRKKAGAEEIVAWTQGWVSRGTRLHRLSAARTLDFAVLTNSALTLVSTGFFSRRPRRRVYCAELHELTVGDDPVPKGRRLRLQASVGPELWIELGSDVQSTAFADALVAGTRREPA
jgi:hypothetical protein